MMLYESPQPIDLHNVCALNHAFLTLLRRDRAIRERLAGLRDDLARRLVSLDPRRAEKLAGVPFLLFSFRERDDRFWRQAFEPGANHDLLNAADRSAAMARLTAAGLGFAWQLARQNPYALRLVSGATVHWCEQLAETPLVRVLEFGSAHADVLLLRAAQSSDLWVKLLDGGVSSKAAVRRAAHMSALHAILTQPGRQAPIAWASAACRARPPALKVADEKKRR
jgi:hypothetical protein